MFSRFQTLGKTGTVLSITETGDIEVMFCDNEKEENQRKFAYHPAALVLTRRNEKSDRRRLSYPETEGK